VGALHTGKQNMQANIHEGTAIECRTRDNRLLQPVAYLPKASLTSSAKSSPVKGVTSCMMAGLDELGDKTVIYDAGTDLDTAVREFGHFDGRIVRMHGIVETKPPVGVRSMNMFDNAAGVYMTTPGFRMETVGRKDEPYPYVGRGVDYMTYTWKQKQTRGTWPKK